MLGFYNLLYQNVFSARNRNERFLSARQNTEEYNGSVGRDVVKLAPPHSNSQPASEVAVMNYQLERKEMKT